MFCGLAFMINILLAAAEMTVYSSESPAGKHLVCETPYQKFFFPKSKLIISCTLMHEMNDLEIKRISLLLNNQSWIYETYCLPDVGMSVCNFNITRDNFTSSYRVWTPKGQWKVYSEIYYSTGKVLEVQGTLLDDMTEPILQWSLGDAVTKFEVPGSDHIKELLFAQSTCASDVLLIVPIFDTGSDLYFGLTKMAFVDRQILWFRRNSLCHGCELVDIKLTNYFLIVLTNTHVLRSVYLSEKQNSMNMTFEPVFTIAKCKSQKIRNLAYTPQCIRSSDSFMDDVVAVFYECLSDSRKKVTHLFLSSVRTNFTKWIDVHDFLTLPESILSVAFNPQSRNLMLVYNLMSTSVLEVHHVWESLTVELKTVYHPFFFESESKPMKIFVHPISNSLYAYGDQVWVSQVDGQDFTIMWNTTSFDVVKSCVTGHSGEVACITGDNKILYSRSESLMRLWNVEPHQLLFDGKSSVIFFDYMGFLYIGHLEQGMMQLTMVDVKDAIQKRRLQLSHPLLVHFISQKHIRFYQYNIGSEEANLFASSSIGMLITCKDGGSVVIRKSLHSSDEVIATGFLDYLYTYTVDPLVPSNSTALSGSLNLENWDSVAREGEFSLSTGSWSSSDLWKTIVVPSKTSFLVTKVFKTRVKVKSITNILNMSTVKSGKWKMYDFSPMSWTVKEDKCRHSLTYDLDIARRRTVTNIDLKTKESTEFSLGILSPFTLGNRFHLFGYLSNPSLFSTNFYHSYSGSPLREKLIVEIMPIINRKSRTTLKVFAMCASMLCETSTYFIVINGDCPPTQKIVFTYPDNITSRDFLPGFIQPETKNFLIDLDINYRPPSDHGYSIPTSDNIYNVDPSVPFPLYNFKISQKTGRLRHCANVTRRIDCECSDEMIMTDDAQYTECKMRAYKMAGPARLRPNFTLMSYGNHVALPDIYLVRIFDVNNRSITIEYQKGATENVFLDSLRADERFSKMAQKYYDPSRIVILMKGSGLYHLRAEIMPGLSFCPLYVDFQVYVIPRHLQYPVPFVLDLIVALVLGGILLVLALWYSNKQPTISSRNQHMPMENVIPDHHPSSLPLYPYSGQNTSQPKDKLHVPPHPKLS